MVWLCYSEVPSRMLRSNWGPHVGRQGRVCGGGGGGETVQGTQGGRVGCGGGRGKTVQAVQRSDTERVQEGPLDDASGGLHSTRQACIQQHGGGILPGKLAQPAAASEMADDLCC